MCFNSAIMAADITAVASRKSDCSVAPLRLWPGAAKAEPYDEMRDEKGS